MIDACEDKDIQQQQETNFFYSNGQGCSVTLEVIRCKYAQQVIVIIGGPQGARAY